MKTRIILFCLTTLLLFCSSVVFSQSGYPVNYTLPEKIEAAAGKSFNIAVVFTTRQPWYIYAPTGNNAAQGMIETDVIYQLPKGITRKGKPRLPATHYKGGFEIYEGKDIKISQAFAVSKDVAPGEYLIKARINYQTCSEKSCLPPKTDEVTIVVTVKTM